MSYGAGSALADQDHAHGSGDLLLAQSRLLAGLGELVPACLGEQPTRTRLDF
jgi:hypothetical protein